MTLRTRARLTPHGLLWLLMGAVMAAIAVVSFLVPGAQGALSAQLRNTDNSASVRYYSCAQAIAATPGLTAGFQLTATTTANLGKQGGGRDGRNTTYTAAGDSNIGCKNDTPKTSLNFNGTASSSGASGTQVWNTADLTGTATYSQEVWFRTSYAQGVIMGFANVENYRSEANYNRMIWINSNGRLVAGTSELGPFTTVTSPRSVTDNSWHHVVVTRDADANVLKLYLDGALVGSDTTAGDPPTITGHWRVGCMKMDSWPDNGGTTKECFRGNMQFFAAYDRPLTAAEVSDHFLAGRVWGP